MNGPKRTNAASKGALLNASTSLWQTTCQMVCFLFHSEGPCLVHTITGDLLRALEGPDHYRCPRLISVSSEGHCIIYYDRGRFCNFSINGKLLAQMEVNDSTRVSRHTLDFRTFCLM